MTASEQHDEYAAAHDRAEVKVAEGANWPEPFRATYLSVLRERARWADDPTAEGRVRAVAYQDCASQILRALDEFAAEAAAHTPTVGSKLRAAIEADVLRRVAGLAYEIKRIGNTPYDQLDRAELAAWSASPLALLHPSIQDAVAEWLRAEADRIEGGAR